MMNVNKCQLKLSGMSHKQTIQIPVDSCTSIILDIQVFKSPYPLSGGQNLVGAVCKSRNDRKLSYPYVLFVDFLKQVALATSKTYKWFSNLGKGEIDIRRIETAHNQYLGLRIRGMDR